MIELKMENEKRKIFISYTRQDAEWALWIADTLKKQGHETIVMDWDFRPGDNFVLKMDEALQTSPVIVAVLSKAYLDSYHCQTELTAAYANKNQKLIPVRVDDFKVRGLWAPINYVDLVNKTEDEAIKLLERMFKAPERKSHVYPGGKAKVDFTKQKHTNGMLTNGDWMPPNNLPDRNNKFTGHLKLLEEIHRIFNTKNDVSLIESIVITGMGGIGKSEIAKAYAYRYCKDYQHILWVNAETGTSIEAAYRYFAERNRIGTPKDDSETVIRNVKTWMQEHNHWLFIYDNAENEKSLKKYCSSSWTAGQHILVTSRSRLFIRFLPINISVFNEAEACEFIENYTNKPADEYFRLLAKKMGYLPLALDQAGAYMYVHNMSYKEYLDLYDKYPLELLSEYDDDLEKKTVSTTWMISFNKIVNPATKQLLYLCAFFAPDKILSLWFKQASKVLPDELREAANHELKYKVAIRELTMHSLVSQNEEGDLNIHPLVQRVIRDSLKQEQTKWRNICIKILNELCYTDFSTTESRTHFLLLVPHINFITQGISDKEMTEEIASLYYYLGWGFDELGDYSQSLNYYRNDLLASEKVFGKEHPNTATTYNNIGEVYLSLGNYNLALEYFVKALSVREKVLGEEHPDIATSYNNIGTVYDSQGNYDLALEYYRKALSICEKVLSEEHPSTATSYNNIGVVYCTQGNYDLAFEYYKKALNIREKVLGKEHPDTAISYNNIGSVYREQGNYDLALEYYMKTLSIHEKVFGGAHPNTADSYNNIGGELDSKGDYNLALEYYMKALSIREKVLGEEHPSTAQSYNNIGGVFDSQGKYDLALEYCGKALSICERVFGIEHPDTATTYNNIAGIYLAMSNNELAFEYYRKALTIYEKVLGKEHSNTKTVVNNMTYILEKSGKPELLDEWYNKYPKSKEPQYTPYIKVDLEENQVSLNECKVTFLGYGDVGKTCIINKIINPELVIDPNNKSTDGIHIRKWPPKGFDGTIRFWDFGGQEIMRSMHRCFITDKSVCVIVLDGREDAMIDQDAIRWIETINTFSSNVPIILVINKVDKYEKSSLRETELMISYPQIVNIFRTSMITSEGLKDLSDCLLQTVSNSDGFKELDPPKLKVLMNSIENSTDSYISWDSFGQLCSNIGINDVGDQYKSLGRLKSLGILHFYEADSGKERQVHNEERAILKPEWLTNGIYRIINRISTHNGFIEYSELYKTMAKTFDNDVLPEVTYNESEVGYILYVMRKFNLSYEADDFHEFIPITLTKDSKDIVRRFKTEEYIHVSWESNSIIPHNVLYHIMIAKYGQLSEQYWKYGAVFNTNDKASSALIEFDINEKSINIYVKSKHGEAKEYFSELRNAIRQALGRIKVEENVHYWEKLENGEIKEGKLSYEEVLAYLRKGMEEIYDKSFGIWVNVRRILNIIHSKETITTIINNIFMERQINIKGNHTTYIEKAEEVHVTTIEQNALNLPNEMSEEKWQQFKAFIEQFLASEEADELRGKDRKILEGGKSWGEIREVLADAANATTILLPLTTFVVNHGEQITQWITALFSF